MTSESMNDVMYIVVVVYNQYVSVYYYHSGRVETIMVSTTTGTSHQVVLLPPFE